MPGNHNSGRRPKPTALKVLEGNRGRRELNTNEPHPAPRAPEIPASLTDEERAEWEYICFQLDSMGTLAISDKYVIQQLAQAVVDYNTYRAYIREHGATYEAFIILDNTGKPVDADVAKAVIKKRPECDLMKQARQDIYRFSTLLGLDPSSRSRLHVGAPRVVDTELSDLLSPDA